MTTENNEIRHTVETEWENVELLHTLHAYNMNNDYRELEYIAGTSEDRTYEPDGILYGRMPVTCSLLGDNTIPLFVIAEGVRFPSGDNELGKQIKRIVAQEAAVHARELGHNIFAVSYDGEVEIFDINPIFDK